MRTGWNDESLTWRKSTFSNGSGGECVEVAQMSDGQQALRDTKNLGAGPVLLVSRQEWMMFVRGVRNSL